VNSTKLEQLRKKLPRNNQQGFTLIELLVVISILGILAAVVTMSLVGVQAAATERSRQAELAAVQTAFDTDVQVNEPDTNVDATAACNSIPAGGTKDLTSFPGGKGTIAGSTVLPPLYPNYLHVATSKFTYFCANATTGTLKSTNP
jgi:prepilin-type N-terminal cleavage/methylation domain-containing protein